MTGGESWTIGRLLQWTAAYLRDHGAEHSRLDAEVLLAHVRGCKRIELYTSFNEEVSEADRSSYRELIRQRAQGKPVAYLVGYREFYSLSFVITPDVLIPRPETELLVRNALDWIAAAPDRRTIADVGTGSGCIAISIAVHVPTVTVLATDISAPALEVARANARKFQVSDRIRFVECDLLPPHTHDLTSE